MRHTDQKIKEAIETLKGFEDRGFFYWLKVIVNRGELTEAEAGFIIRGIRADRKAKIKAGTLETW